MRRGFKNKVKHIELFYYSDTLCKKTFNQTKYVTVFTLISFGLFPKRMRLQLFVFFFATKLDQEEQIFSCFVVDKWKLLCIDYDFHILQTKENFIALQRSSIFVSVAIRFIDFYWLKQEALLTLVDFCWKLRSFVIYCIFLLVCSFISIHSLAKHWQHGDTKCKLWLHMQHNFL